MKNNKFLIINRTFWPDNDVIGEALLTLAEKTSIHTSTYVVCLSKKRIKEKLVKYSRGSRVQFKSMRSITTSSSNLFLRILESFLFTLWTLISLIRIRPCKIYISTDPPLIIPFTIYMYSRIFNCEYFYHLQDIHPEASNSVLKMKSFFYKLFVIFDNMTINGAKKIITLSNEMEDYIIKRSNTTTPIVLISNCAVKYHSSVKVNKENELIFCGNIGRLQLIPLLVDAILEYLNSGGTLKFNFIGVGVNSPLVEELAKNNNQVIYLGKLSSHEASKQLLKKQWAILSLEDDICKYAFPSKTSSYIINDCRIFAISGAGTSITNYINRFDLGVVSRPNINEIVKNFFKIEKKIISYSPPSENIKEEITMDYFVNKIIETIEI